MPSMAAIDPPNPGLSTSTPSPGEGDTVRLLYDYVHTGPKGDKTRFKAGETYPLARESPEGYWVTVKPKGLPLFSKSKHFMIPKNYAQLMGFCVWYL